MTPEERQVLRGKLKDKLFDRRIGRSKNKTKEHILEETLRSQGIDVKKFKEDLERVQKEGGLSMDLTQ